MNNPITAQLVADERRLDFLPAYFGVTQMMRGEALVYAWMCQLSKDYRGGYWNFYELSNGGFYLAPLKAKRLQLAVPGNGFSGEVSADAAGVVATLFALGQLAAEVEDGDAADELSTRYHLLRDFACGHEEAADITRAID